MAADSGWSPVSRARTHEQVLEQIEAQIVRGTLRTGDRLPSERALMELLDVSRSSIREALRILESIGIIASTGTRGTEAGWVISDHPSPALGRLLRLHLALARFELSDLVQTRVLLERWACQHAAERGDNGNHLDAVQRTLEAMNDEALSPRDFNRLDTQLHIRIAEASGNVLLRDLMQALRDAVEREMVAAFERLTDWRAAAAQLRQEHAGILDALRAGEGDKAAALVEQHIVHFYRDQLGI
jgi:GntR family transcriptional regulator, transcriptional repressor for pyruvate dehydrogenase complex